MRIKTLSGFVVAILLFLSAGVSSGDEKKSEKSPAVFIPQDSYTVANIVEGAVIEQDFIVQNKGDADLHILSVTPG